MPRKSPKNSHSQFCRACGLCCNGVLHPYTSIHPDEVDLVRTFGLTIVPRKGTLSFPQPCALYKKGLCSNYPHRPSACRAYECALLKKYLAGETDLQSGVPIIQESKERYAALLHRIPDGYSFDQLRTALDSEADSDRDAVGANALRQTHAAVFHELLQFIEHLLRHFGMKRVSG